jgi:hypothetical protein
MRKNDAQLTTQRLRWRWTGLGLALGLAVGCGDSSDGTTGSGGTGAAAGNGGGGGAGARTAGDSGTRDGDNSPRAQGSVSLHLTELADAVTQCSPGRQWVNAPSAPTAVQRQQTSDVEIGTRAVEGMEGARVECAVQKIGDKFSFSADITTSRTDGTQVLHPTVLHFDASAITTGGAPAKGTVTAMTDTTGGNFADDQCSYSVGAQGSSSSLGIAEGKIWAGVTCEQLAHPTDPDDVCRIDVGFLVFENCLE